MGVVEDDGVPVVLCELVVGATSVATAVTVPWNTTSGEARTSIGGIVSRDPDLVLRPFQLLARCRRRLEQAGHSPRVVLGEPQPILDAGQRDLGEGDLLGGGTR